MGWMRLTLRMGETLQCDGCDAFVSGPDVYLFVDKRGVGEVLCDKCQKEATG